MNGHSIWFESPLPKLPTPLHPRPLPNELDPDPEDSHFARPHPASPTPTPFKLLASALPLSPWSSLLNQDIDPKPVQLSLPPVLAVRQQEAIG